MLPYILPLSRIRITCYAPLLLRKNIQLDFLIKRSDAASLDALNLLSLFGDSNQLGSKLFLSNVVAELVAAEFIHSQTRQFNIGSYHLRKGKHPASEGRGSCVVE